MKRFLILLIIAACSSLVFAQWSTDPAQNLQILDNSIKPRIVTDGEGGAIVVGESFTQNPVLYAQRIDKHGYILWDPSLRGIRVTTAGDEQANVIVVSDGAGGAYVGFDARKIVGRTGEPPDPIYSSFVRVQHFDPNGNRLVGPEGVAVYPYSNSTNGGQVLFALVPDEHGGVYVMWSDIYGPQGYNVYINHVQSNGQISWENSVALSPPISWIQRDFLVYPDGTGGVIIYYMPGGTSLSHKFFRINQRGEIVINKPIQTGLTVFYLFAPANGECILFWQDFNQFMQLDTIRCQKIDRNGEKLWGENPVIVDTAGQLATPLGVGRLTDRNNGAFFAYRAGITGTRLVHIDNRGRILFNKSAGRFNGTGWNFQECMAAYKQNGVLYSAYHPNEGLFVHFVDSSGVEIRSATLFTKRIAWAEWDGLVFDDNDGVIFTWFEIDPTRGIWIQQVSGTGQLGIVTSVKELSDQNSTPKSFELLPAYPNPFRGTVRIAYKLPRNEMVVVKVYNLSGKEVITLVEQKQASGLNEIVWNGRDQNGRQVSSGVYFYQWSAGKQKQANKLVLLRN